ncbi:MAG: AMP-dependent synthetase and ligase [Verrucomicrobia bacterium]|nr:AMP-dependent synthetase and ligase [Verrucomicrobiota bacterium]
MPTPGFRRRSYVPFFFEVIASAVARLLYRVRQGGTEFFPRTGGVLLIANHLSYVDPVVLQLACPRPIRFVGYKGLQENRFFEWVFRLSGSIPISRGSPTEGMRRAIRALQAGEVVAIFPEGHISRTGQLMPIMRGFEVVARKAGVPVLPAFIDGVWGSVFSFADNKYLWKSPRLMPTPVFVQFGAPVPPAEASPLLARKILMDLGAMAFDQRPVLRRHLGRECVQALAKHPGRVAVVDRTGPSRAVKAGQLLATSAALSRHLRRTIPEQRVGIVLPPGAGAFVANLAVVCAGKIPVNLNFTAGRAALEASMKLGRVSTVISAEAVRQKVPAFPWPERTLDLKKEIDAMGGKKAIFPWLVAAWVLPNQVCASLLGLPHVGDRAEAGLLFTSGSSGEPKGVALSHRNILANCAQISSLSILPKWSSLLGCLPIFHSFGFTVTLWYPLIRGCKVITVPSPLDTRRIIDAIRDEKATVLLGAPTFIRPILRKAQPGELRSLELVVTGAEKLPDDLYKAFLETFHLEILQGYGLTETTPASNINQPHPPITTSTAEPQVGKKAGSTGRLLPGMTVRIVDPETGAEVAPGEQGIVWFKGANVFGGYLDDPQKTQGAFRDGWFVTGDLGRLDDEGFLFIEGRLSRFSKIGGEMIPHGTVEQKIAEAFQLDQTDGPAVAVMGVPDKAKGEALVLLTTVPISCGQLRDKLLGAGLANLWVPRIVHLVDKIPVLGTGKLDLKRCRDVALAAAP